MASIYERSSGTFYANFHHDGERTRFSLRTKNRREALRKIEELEEAHNAEKFDPLEDDPFDYDTQDGAPTLSQALREYTEEKRKQGRKDSTLDSYRSSWRMLSDAVGKEITLDELTAEEIEDLIHDREIAQSTRAKRWRHIRCVLNYFDRSDLIERVAAPQRPDSLPTPMRGMIFPLLRKLSKRTIGRSVETVVSSQDK